MFSRVYSIAMMVDDFEQIVSQLFLHHHRLSNSLFPSHLFSIKKQSSKSNRDHLPSIYLKFIHTCIKIRCFLFATEIIIFMFLQASQHLNSIDYFSERRNSLTIFINGPQVYSKNIVQIDREKNENYQMLLFHFHERNHVISRVMLDEIEID